MALRVGLPTGGFQSGLLVDRPEAFTVATTAAAIGLVEEENQALGMFALRGTQLGVAVEADAARPAVSVKSRAIGQASSASEARPLLLSVGQELGLALEFDVPAPMGRHKELDAEEAEEFSVALPMRAGKPPKEIAPAIEASFAAPMARRKAQAIRQVSEVEAALGLGLGRRYAIGQVVELDEAIGVVIEADGAIFVPIGLAAEADVAFAVRPGQLAIGLVEEVGVALPLTWVNPIGLAVEADAALGMTAAKRRNVGQANEFDIALSLGFETLRHYRGRVGVLGTVAKRIGFRRFR